MQSRRNEPVLPNEKHRQPLDATADEYALDEDDYSRTDYGPRLYRADSSEREAPLRDSGSVADHARELHGVSKLLSALRLRRLRRPSA